MSRLGCMERALTAKGRATRDRIVAAAATLMYERGVASTSNEDVLAAAGGVSPSQLYHYFGDRRALVHAVIAHQAALVLGVQEPLLARLDSLEALEAWRDAVVELQAANGGAGGCPVGSLASELADADDDARARLEAGFARWESAIRAGLEAMRERGELAPDADCDRLALALLAALQGGLLLTQVRRDTRPLEVGLTAVIERIRAEAGPAA